MAFVTKKSEIPDAASYVVAEDRFLSGWGMSPDKVNILIAPCDCLEEQIAVEAELRRRPEMSRVRVCINKPRLNLVRCTYSVHRIKVDRWWEKQT